MNKILFSVCMILICASELAAVQLQAGVELPDKEMVRLWRDADQYDMNGQIMVSSATWHGPLEISADCTIKNGTIRNNLLTSDALVTITGGNVVFEDVIFDCSNCSPQALVRIAFGSNANVTFRGNCRFLVGNKNVDAIYVDYCTKGMVVFDSSFTGSVGGKIAIAYESSNPSDDPAVKVSIAGSGTFENIVALDGGSYAFCNSSVSISGGRFAVEPNAACIAAGFQMQNDHTGYWSVLVRERNVWFVDAGKGNDGNNGLSLNTSFATIQHAIDVSLDYDEIVVNDGVYEPIDTKGKRIIVRSINGYSSTIINAYLQWGRGVTNRCARMCGESVETNAVLRGFTLINGIAMKDGIGGGGALGGTIDDCLILGNVAIMGGGAAGSVLIDCTVYQNTAYDGGGAYIGRLIRCYLESNEAYDGGGSLNSDATDSVYYCNRAVPNDNLASGYGGGANGGNLAGCYFIGNEAAFGGAVAYGQHVFSTIEGNFASWHGGGAYEATLRNSLLVNNSAIMYGGGSYRGDLKNCTISGNSQTAESAKGGGTYDAKLANCIVWGNRGHVGSDDVSIDGYVSAYCQYCCTKNIVPGEGNIAKDPLFRDATSGNYRLKASSPCIDTGSSLFVEDDVDMHGTTRILGACVDMGAFEYRFDKTGSTPIPVPHEWLEDYPELMDKANKNYNEAASMVSPGNNGAGKTKRDGTPMYVWEDYLAGTDPTDTNSVFTAEINLVEGKPVITWKPDSAELRATRKYTTFGKKTLDGNVDWTDITNKDTSEYNFFKVSVDMP